MSIRLFKYSLVALSVTLLLHPDTAAAAEQDEAESVVVTGSRIKSIDLEGESPVQVIDEEDIESSTATNLDSLLKELAVTHGGDGSFSTHNSGALQADSPAGSSAVSLRGLGTASTLVLINGRRVAASSFAYNSQNFVDINSIPLAAIKRVEVLPTGASAIYGADAVAGVVNLILKKGDGGSQISVSYGDSDTSSDESKTNLNGVWSADFDSSDITAFFDIYRKNALYDKDRQQTRYSFDRSQQGIWPSFNTQYFDDIDYVESSCPDDIRYDGRPGFPNSSFGEYCEYNQNQYLPTYPEFESESIGFASNHYFDDGLTWFNEVFVSRTEGRANSTGAPFSGVAVSFDHPNMPSNLRQRYEDLWNDLGVPPESELLMWGRFRQPRTITNESTSYRFVSGLEGVTEKGWEWDLAANISVSESEQLAEKGIINVAKFEAALFGELCADGTVGCTPANNGLYFNPFGGQSGNQQALDIINERVPRNGESKLYAVDFNVTGDWFELGSDWVKAAYGLEVRREEISDKPAALATADPNNNFEVPVYGFGSTAASASRDIWAAYAEYRVPLTDTFNLQLAGRYDHYSDFGGDFNPKVGFTYRPSDSFLMRGSWNTSFRAPSLAQVGAGTTLGSDSLECTDEFLNNFCGGFGGRDGFLTEVYGNENLKAEESTSYDVGFVFSFANDSTLAIDYWSFEYDNIVGIDSERLFRLALEGQIPVVATDGLDSANQQIGIETRNGNIGDPIDEVHLQLENLGVQEVEGIDLAYTQYFDIDSGELSLLLDGTYLLDFNKQLSKQSEVESLEGTFRYPELILRARLRWSGDDWFGSVTGNYISSYDDDLEGYDEQQLTDFGISREREVPSWVKWNFTVGYDLTGNSYLRLGIDNLLDEEAPVAYGTSANVDHFNHDTYGRFYQLKYTYNF
ncbi:TonB-dependent receptor [Kangiella shandongensis]|uniref:TonB-dependent receptor n=1 Tax=Kangiella shandongensis TaxID=2763258 RepID=UPI001CBA884F|nr:TonB-dependent receptor [Kangiella shandongensis]